MNLTDCTTSDLIAELAQRCPAGIVSIIVPDDGNQYNPSIQSWGNSATVVGLAEIAKIEASRVCFGT